jgi:hypothetical protein
MSINSSILRLVRKNLHDQWREYIIVPVYKKDDKTDCSNYRGISLQSTSYKVVSNVLPSQLSPYVDELAWDTSVVSK